MSENHATNFLILYMSWVIHEDYNKFKALDDKIKALEDMNNPICLMVKAMFNFLDDKWVTSVALAMSIYMTCYM